MNCESTKLAERPSQLTLAVQTAGRQLGALQMTDIRGAADQHDAANLIADLDAVARIVDDLILQIGRYAKSELGVSQKEVDANFTNVLRDALDGNALFILDMAGVELEQAREDTEAETRREFQRSEPWK